MPTVEVNGDEWTCIVSKQYKKTTKNTKNVDGQTMKDIKLEDLIILITKSLEYLSKEIVACFIYGSRARKTNKLSSDVDLLVFMKHELSSDDLKEIKIKLIQDIGISVDLVVCIHTKKWVNHIDERDICYFEQIKPDAIKIMGKDDLTYLIETSKKIGKIS